GAEGAAERELDGVVAGVGGVVAPAHGLAQEVGGYVVDQAADEQQAPGLFMAGVVWRQLCGDGFFFGSGHGVPGALSWSRAPEERTGVCIKFRVGARRFHTRGGDASGWLVAAEGRLERSEAGAQSSGGRIAAFAWPQ